MHIRVNDPTVVGELARFLRAREYLAFPNGEFGVEAVPIYSVSARADRVRLESHLARWLRHERDIEARVHDS